MIIDKLHNHVHSYVINQNCFFEVCPIPLNDLFGKTKLHSVATWRSVGMVWMRLAGLTQTQVGEMFNRHHSTVVYAEHSMLDAFDGFNPQLKEKFDLVLNFGKGTCTINEDLNINLVNSLLTLENYVNRV
jgi:chromosomal replication initiation ATPase DnaA